MRPGDRDVLGHQRLLELQNVLANAANRFQELGIGPAVGLFQLIGRDAQRRGIDFGLVDPPRVVEHRPQAVALDVGADPLDDFRRGERLTENFDRPRPPGVADNIAAGAERSRSRTISARASAWRLSMRRMLKAWVVMGMFWGAADVVF